MLYPQSNAFRGIFNLNGVWDFAAVGEDYIPTQALKVKQPMPVPASYNDIVVDRNLREHVGKVVYEREFSMPVNSEKEYRLRIGATSHRCEVYLNGERIGESPCGFLPVDVQLKTLQEKNRLSVVIDNRLTFQTIPPGMLRGDKQIINFDFYNFTGIHRDVLVYSLPQKHIEDIIIETVVDGDYRKIKATVLPVEGEKKYTVIDGEGKVVATSNNGEIFIENPCLWGCKKPYLYTLCVETGCDKYEERFGIRKVTYDQTGLYLNEEKVYFKGFGKHEDFFISGKGNNTAVNIRDFELLKWIGANSIRTSHYPYCEEIMNLADEYGIMVIDEVPAVGMKSFPDGDNFTAERLNGETQKLHKQMLTKLVERDKNHPCVVMLSVANEAATFEPASREYFADVILHARSLTSLPITIIEDTTFKLHSYVADLVDFIGLNRYYAWYDEHGCLDRIDDLLTEECTKWYEAYRKPIFISEFGADTIEGNHCLPSESFSEEYQCDVLNAYFKSIDALPCVIGEHIWNFADFRTKQGVIRARGNRKGVFTRERQPKAAAFTVKKRWEEKSDFIKKD